MTRLFLTTTCWLLGAVCLLLAGYFTFVLVGERRSLAEDTRNEAQQAALDAAAQLGGELKGLADLAEAIAEELGSSGLLADTVYGLFGTELERESGSRQSECCLLPFSF